MSKKNNKPCLPYAFSRSSSRPFRSRVDARGVTLIELLISVVMIGIVLTVVMAAFMAQNRLYHQSDNVREAQASARIAIGTIERYVRKAGYGIGAEMAFDLERLGCPETDPDIDECRDNTDAPDQLAFAARSLNYFNDPNPADDDPPLRGDAWKVANAGNNVTLRTNGVERRLRQGQVLLITCVGGYTYTYVTVANDHDMPAGPPGGQDFVVSVENHDGNDPFRQTNAFNASTCFDGSLARAFLIEHFRFFIQNETFPGSPDPRPFLYLDRGFGGPVPVASDIEDLQVVYITRSGEEFGSDGGSAQNLDIGAFAGGTCDHADEIRVPFYRSWAINQCPRRCPRRALDHVANISQVRITVVARTAQEVRGQQNRPEPHPAHVPSAFSVENRDRDNEPDDGFRRVRLTTTIDLPNMVSRGIPGI